MDVEAAKIISIIILSVVVTLIFEYVGITPRDIRKRRDDRD